MKIITNPDFFLLGYKSNKNKIKSILDAADDYVILGTFLFCNNTLHSADLVEHSDWPEVYQQMAIASKGFTKYYERPDFYDFEFVTQWEPGCYVFATRNIRVEYKKGTRKKGLYVCRGVNEENLKKHFKEIQKDMEMWYTRTGGFLPLIRK